MKIPSFILTYCLFATTLVAQTAVSLDTVHLRLQTLNATDKLVYLDKLTTENTLTSSRLALAELLEKEAEKQQNKEYLANAVYMLAKHYYVVNSDSMRYYINKAEPLFIQFKRYEDLCRMKAWNIYGYNTEGDNNNALKAIDELKKLSDQLDYPEGNEMADQALADFYLTNGIPAEGERVYTDVLKRMESRNAPLVKQFNIIRQLFTKMPDLEKKLDYLAMAVALTDQAKAKGLTQLDVENPVYAVEYTINRSYAVTYIDRKEFDKAWEHLQKTQKIADEHNLNRSHFELLNLYSLYYYWSGDYAKALEYIDQLEISYKARNRLRALMPRLIEKAFSLEQLGRHKEASLYYREYIKLNDSIYTEDLNQQLAKMRTTYQVEKLELQNQQMEIEATRAQSRMLMLIIGLLVLTTIILIMARLIRIINKKQTELKLAKERAEEADRLKSAFLANMNHEIRTPLNAIVGFSQILIDEEDKELRRDYAGIIDNNNELLQRLIADVLDISKIESNSMSLMYTTQDIPEIMREAYSSIVLRLTEGVELFLDPCKPLVMETDRNRVVQIITNLLTNAVKHTEKGYIRFGYVIEDDNAHFYVEDTGKGISSDKLESIFDRFVQLENTKKGVGLGLAICKGLVAKMGGSIWAISTVGEGSTFHVTLPINNKK